MYYAIEITVFKEPPAEPGEKGPLTKTIAPSSGQMVKLSNIGEM